MLAVLFLYCLTLGLHRGTIFTAYLVHPMPKQKRAKAMRYPLNTIPPAFLLLLCEQLCANTGKLLVHLPALVSF